MITLPNMIINIVKLGYFILPRPLTVTYTSVAACYWSVFVVELGTFRLAIAYAPFMLVGAIDMTAINASPTKHHENEMRTE
eukprot:scaffold1533_cov164-Skeletonema_menzelii.AAC.3